MQTEGKNKGGLGMRLQHSLIQLCMIQSLYTPLHITVVCVCVCVRDVENTRNSILATKLECSQLGWSGPLAYLFSSLQYLKEFPASLNAFDLQQNTHTQPVRSQQ